MSKADKKKSQGADAPYREALKERGLLLADIEHVLNSKKSQQSKSLKTYLVLMKHVISAIKLDSIPVEDAKAVYTATRIGLLKKLRIEKQGGEMTAIFETVDNLAEMDVPEEMKQLLLAAHGDFLRSVYAYSTWKDRGPEFMEVMKFVIWADYGAQCQVFDSETVGRYIQKQKAHVGRAILEKAIPHIDKPVLPFKNPLKL